MTKGISNQFSFCVHDCQIPFTQSLATYFISLDDSNWSWFGQFKSSVLHVKDWLQDTLTALPNLLPFASLIIKASNSLAT